MDIKKGKIVYPKIKKENPIDEIKETSYEDILDKPNFIARTSTSVDLSGAATSLICFHTELSAELVRAFLLYTEASSADAGITIEVGTETDADYYYTGTTEASKAIWYTLDLTLLKKDITKGDTIILTSAGSKSGTGTIMLVIEYKIKGIYRGE